MYIKESLESEETMKVVKKQSPKTYQDKNKKEHHYYNYFLQCDNGKRILIKPVNNRLYSLA